MENVQQGSQADPTKISGLGGWLVFVQIGLYWNLMTGIVSLVLSGATLFATDFWSSVTSRDSEDYHVLWGPVIVMENVYLVALVGSILYILVNFYGRKQEFCPP